MDCPFPDVEVSEVLDDDPWFADLDAARDAGSGVAGDGGAAGEGVADVEGDGGGFAPECPFEDDGEPGAPVGVRSVGDELSDLLARRPDAYVVVRLAGIDARSLSPEDAIVYLQVAQRTEAWQAALAVHAYVAAGSGHALVQEVQAFDPHPDSDEQITIRIEDAIREEISTALRLSGQAAHERLVTSRLLAGPMTATLEALACGSITASHARVVTDAAKRLPGWIVVHRPRRRVAPSGGRGGACGVHPGVRAAAGPGGSGRGPRHPGPYPGRGESGGAGDRRRRCRPPPRPGAQDS